MIDSHVHLDSYDDVAIDAMLDRAKDAGVTVILAVGADVASSKHALRVAARRSGLVLPAVGIHPHRVPQDPNERRRAVDEISALASDAVAIGEVGLDYGESPAPRSIQRETFAEMARIAGEHGLPLNLHEREAYGDLTLLLRQEAPDARATLHYFSGTAEEATHAVAQGFFISFGKPVTRDGGEGLRMAASRIDRARVLAETDTYASPHRRTEPRDVVLVVSTLARIWSVSVEEAGRQVLRNFDAYLGR